jgi:hypothetical protein
MNNSEICKGGIEIFFIDLLHENIKWGKKF